MLAYCDGLLLVGGVRLVLACVHQGKNFKRPTTRKTLFASQTSNETENDQPPRYNRDASPTAAVDVSRGASLPNG